MNPGCMYQLVPALIPGDAISDQVLAIDAAMRSWGWRCGIIAEHAAAGATEHLEPVGKLDSIGVDDLVLYHHSTGSNLARRFMESRGIRKVLVYHNITPPELLAHAPAIAAKAQRGRAQLSQLARITPLALADSELNRAELVRHGIRRTKVLPLVVSPARAALFASAAIDRAGFARSGACFLFVGRVVPHKRIELLLNALAIYQREHDANARLHVVGPLDEAPRYARELATRSEDIPNVYFRGKLLGTALGQEFAHAHAYWSASAHEGFCLPLVEAMIARLPVVAVKAGAVEETLGGSGILIPDADPAMIAEASARVISDSKLRQHVIDHQHARAQRFEYPAFVDALSHALDGLLKCQ
jgi:L-malate glycosyltransferase